MICRPSGAITNFQLYLDILIEHFVSGQEITVVRVGNGDDADIIPLILVWEGKVVPPTDFIFFKDDKMGLSPLGKRCTWRLASSFLDVEVCKKLSETVRQLADVFETRDLVRMDFRVSSDNQIHFIETNAQPNLNSHRGGTTFAINAEFYKSKNQLEKKFLMSFLKRIQETN